MKLTQKAIQAAGKEVASTGRPRKFADGGGLFLLINPNGSKWWRLAYRYGGRQKTISMGVFPDTGLDEARDQREAARKLLREGIDPSAARQAEKALQIDATENTFGAVAAEWVAKNRETWSPATLTQTESRLKRDVLPYLSKRPIRELSAPEILATVQRVVDRGATETARRVLRIIKQICTHAVVTGRLKTNPASDLASALPTPKVSHMSALTEPEAVAGLMRAIAGYEGEPVTRAALQLAPLVFVRPGELRTAEWAEIDLHGARWDIPAAKMKMDEPLVVPLARQAVAVLEGIQPLTDAGRYVFPGARSAARPMSNNTLNAALRRLGYSKDEMTSHGFRAMARTLLEEELGFRYELIEQQLGHQVIDPNGRAYNRTRNLPERTKMMQAWADYLDRLRDGDRKVRQLKARA